MAERRGNPTGRMLFTDFDASDKGRPSTPARENSGSSVGGFLNTPIPTIEQLASSLELDFEDDFREEAASPAVPAFGYDDEEDYIPDIATVPPVAPAAEKHQEPSAGGTAKPERNGAFRRGDATAIIDNDPLLVETSAPWRPLPPAPTVERDTNADSPYRFTETGSDDDDLDILSALPFHDEFADDSEAVYRPFEGKWRGSRLGMEPPRSTPYGGIRRLEKWYRPPEIDPEELAGTPPPPGGDWYEPPTERREKDTFRSTNKPSPDTTGVDLFSGLDLNALWEEKVRRRRPSSAGTGTSVTGTQDLFSGIDLDSAWEEKQRRFHSASTGGENDVRPDRRTRPDSEGADSTMILEHGALPPPDLLHPEEPLPEPAQETVSSRSMSRRSKRGKRKKTSSLPPRVGNEADALGFLEDLDNFFNEGQPAAETPERKSESKSKRMPGQAPANKGELELSDLVEIVEDRQSGERTNEPAKKKTPNAPVQPPSHDSPIPAGDGGHPGETAGTGKTAGEDTLFADDFLDSLGPAVNDSVKAPVIDDSAIESLGKGKANADASAEEETISAPEKDGEDTPRDEPAEETLANEGESAEEPAPPPIGLDALLERESAASPPQIKRPREGNAGERAGDGTAEGGEAEAEPDAAAVAVNPMDVFANMDGMDFSDDGLDDDMKAMLEEDEEPESAVEAEGEAAPATGAAAPGGFVGKVLYFAKKGVGRVVPWSLLEKISDMIAWRENWGVYCDLVAAVIASASLAVIISYYLWYS